MKLSKREKALVSILLLAAIVYFGYQFVPFEKIFKLSALEDEYSQKKSTYDTMSRNIIVKTTYEKKVQELTTEINNINMLTDLNQEQIIVFLNKYLANNNIDANSINFTDIVVNAVDTSEQKVDSRKKSSFESMMDNINPSSTVVGNITETDSQTQADSKDKQQDASKTTDKEESTVDTISVNVSFESSYSDMIKFIDAIQNNPIDIAITNINTLSDDGNSIQGAMTLNFYSVPKLDGFVEQNKDWVWEDIMQSGKINPFLLEGGTAFVNTESTGYDFYMSLKPESSDLPTVILGKAEDKDRVTYVYADSNTMENVEFQFKKENSKYYYKYSTKNASFPSDGSWLEFTPLSSSIDVKVYSTQRNSKTDSAGANIAVVNTTGLKIKFEIEDDDNTNPRVYFKDPKSVVVTRK
jgi:type IV pilus assembly protein PilO